MTQLAKSCLTPWLALCLLGVLIFWQQRHAWLSRLNRGAITDAVRAKEQKFIARTALLIMPITGGCVDIYAPSLPAIAHYFSSNLTLAQLVITTYILAYGVSQLPFGTLSDSWGRKPVMLLGILLFLLATLLMPFASSITYFLFLRALQGIAMGALNGPCRALVPDTFSGSAYHKVANQLTLAWGVGPIFAPVIGSQLQQYVGWKASTWFLILYGLLILLKLIRLPETHAPSKRTKLSDCMKHYRSILAQPAFLAYLAIITLLYAVLLVFNIVGPFLIQSVMGCSVTTYGRISLLLGVAWLSGNYANRLKLNFSIREKTLAGLLINCALALEALYLFQQFPVSIYALTAILFFLVFFSGYIFPNGFGFCLAAFPKASGAVSAIMGTLLVTGSGLVTLAASALPATSVMPLMSVYLISFIVGILIVLLLNKEKHSQ